MMVHSHVPNNFKSMVLASINDPCFNQSLFWRITNGDFLFHSTYIIFIDFWENEVK